MDKFDPDFLNTRQKALDKFMCRVVDHPVLSFNQSLKTFLSAKAWVSMTTELFKIRRFQQEGVITKINILWYMDLVFMLHNRYYP